MQGGERKKEKRENPRLDQVIILLIIMQEEIKLFQAILISSDIFDIVCWSKTKVYFLDKLKTKVVKLHL